MWKEAVSLGMYSQFPRSTEGAIKQIFVTSMNTTLSQIQKGLCRAKNWCGIKKCQTQFGAGEI